MRSWKRWLPFALVGIVPAAAMLFAAECLLRGAASVLQFLGPVFEMSASEIEQFSMILGQLNDAEIRLPFVLIVLLSCVFCALTAWVLYRVQKGKRGVRIALTVLLWVILLPVLFSVTLWFTEVNSIQLGMVLRSAAALL